MDPSLLTLPRSRRSLRNIDLARHFGRRKDGMRIPVMPDGYSNLKPDRYGVHPYCETEKLRDNSMLVSSNAAFSDGVDKVFSYSSGVR